MCFRCELAHDALLTFLYLFVYVYVILFLNFQPTIAGRKARCATANCPGQTKHLFHRRCATEEAACSREPIDGSHVPAVVCGDGVRERFPTNPDTTTTATVADVNHRDDVAEDAPEAGVAKDTWFVRPDLPPGIVGRTSVSDRVQFADTSSTS